MNQHAHDHEHPHDAQTKGSVIRWAGWYDFFINRVFGGLSRRMRTAPLKLAGIKPGDTILDFGSGAGDLAFEAERLVGGNGKIVGIDHAAEMIAVAKQKALRKKSRVQFQVEAAEKLSFAYNTFDVAMSSFVLHHLPGDLQAQAFAELKRVLKPGGLFFNIDMRPLKISRIRIAIHGEGPKPATMPNGLQIAAEKMRKMGFRDVSVGETSFGAGFVRGTK